MSWFHLLFALPIGLLALGMLLRLLHPLPRMPERTPSAALSGEGTRLSRVAMRSTTNAPELSGVVLLSEGRDAFAARAAIARSAERSLDLQYYIWHADLSGRLLLLDVLDAADRGVRIRFLIDDNGTEGLDEELAALSLHPAIEVRLFNPFTIRKPKAVGYLMDFSRLNRRMHNKAFVADNQAAVIGGRNVGDEYFGATTESLFEDLDLLAVGPIVQELSTDFDRYWASQSSYPATAILPAAGPDALAALRSELKAAATDPLAKAYVEAVRDSAVTQAGAGPGAGVALPLEWVPVAMVSDDPRKGKGEVPRRQLMADRLARLVGAPDRRLSMVSAYFVPMKAGSRLLTGLADRGVEVAVMTNALESTDVAAVHAGYAKHRRTLLRAGVRLWELRAAPGHHSRLRLGFGSASGKRPVIVASGSSLHAKTFAVDGGRLFVGSFNFDPRSLVLNTELGFLVDSPALAAGLDAMFDGPVAERAYEVRLTPRGDMEWIETTPEGPIVHSTEPGTRLHQRILIRLMSLLPIDWLL